MVTAAQKNNQNLKSLVRS